MFSLALSLMHGDPCFLIQAARRTDQAPWLWASTFAGIVPLMSLDHQNINVRSATPSCNYLASSLTAIILLPKMEAFATCGKNVTDSSKVMAVQLVAGKKLLSIAMLCGLPEGEKGSSSVLVAATDRSTSTLTLVEEKPEHSLSPKRAPRSCQCSHGAQQLFSPDAQYSNLLLQPSYRPISPEQLTAEVKSIYAGLTSVETKCINIHRSQATAVQGELSEPSKLGQEHWQALTALHRTLLHEHHDFFLASQHPSAEPALHQLAARYAMPAQLLRQQLPESLNYMLAFISTAYRMMALLYETVPALQDIWIECLGDLSRYRMAIEEEDLHDREIWADVARSWYSKAANMNPSVGRLYHHLAILARPNIQQLYYYCRSLTCVQPFTSGRKSMLTFLDPFLGRAHEPYSQGSPINASFIKAHGILFVGESLDTFPNSCSNYLHWLDTQISRNTTKWKKCGVYVAITNVASLFNYGFESSTLRQMYNYKIKLDGPARPSMSPPEQTSEDEVFPPQDLNFASQPTFAYACQLAFTTFSLVLWRVGNENVLPHVHVMLVFLLSLTDIPYDCAFVLNYVPWEYLALFLTRLAKSEKLDSLAENTPVLVGVWLPPLHTCPASPTPSQGC
ncbi:hypothetical protein K469DRAFT_746653 [Zopfia rhizophila CBS 207.26]|uniref:DNA/RNA-binding domain-containing protein n=1 Tax=Zopfia rhizophila CBS 207.26 TaxID=1314779 RepID=A0A6A6EKI0_9PEZI|nr:hypothetical protein K469DRAFT_746653 [Zopfia rhizophila CBS 207.26]